MDTSKRLLYSTLALLTAAAFAFGPHAAQAQNEPGAFYLGIDGGLAQSSLTGDAVESDSRRGFNGGVHFMYNINEALSAELGINYAKRGAKGLVATGGPSTSDAYDYDGDQVTLDYLKFPVLLKLTAPIEAVKVRALVGPSIKFLTDATENGTDIQGNFQSEPPVIDRYLLYDLAGVVGGEVALPLPGLLDGEVALDGRYNFGLRNVDQTQGFKMKNRSFTGSLILRFSVQ